MIFDDISYNFRDNNYEAIQSFYLPTMRDVPSEAEAQSHRLLLKSGLIKQSTSGIYSYLPLATRVLNNTAIVRQEMERIDSVEIFNASVTTS